MLTDGRAGGWPRRSRQVDIWAREREGEAAVVLTYDSARGPHQERDELRSMERARSRFWDRKERKELPRRDGAKMVKRPSPSPYHETTTRGWLFRCTRRSNWILHRKWKHYICCLRDVI